MRVGATLLVLAASFVAGCSLIYSGDLDAAREPVASVPDGSGSSSAGSSGVSGEGGGPDSGEGGSPEAGPVPGCKGLVPAPKFCEDFDGTVSDTWSFNEEGGKVLVSSEQTTSSPNGLKVTLDTPKECQYSRLERRFDEIGTKRFTVKIKAKLGFPWSDGKTPLVVGMGQKDGPGYCAALFYVYSNSDGHTKAAAINVQSDTIENHFEQLKGYPSDGAWTDITVTATQPGPNGGTRFSTTFQDESGFSLTTDHDFAECKTWNNAGVYAGFHCDTGKGTAFYDDVRVDWE